NVLAKDEGKQVYEDGQYLVDADFGVMKSYMEEGAVIDIENGVYIVTVTFKMADFIEGFKVKDRKSTRLNSSHVSISYAVFCLKNATPTKIYTLSLHDALPI